MNKYFVLGFSAGALPVAFMFFGSIAFIPAFAIMVALLIAAYYHTKEERNTQ